MVTRRRIEPRRRLERPVGRAGGRRRRRPGRRRIVVAAAALAGVAALAIGLTVTYVAQADASAPTRLASTSTSPTSATLTWRGTGAEQYRITIGDDRALSSARRSIVPGSATSITIDDLAATTPGADRYFRVDSIDGGKVTPSRTARFTLQPARMSKVKVPRVSANGVKATWKAVANARQYDVMVSHDKTFGADDYAVRTLQATNSFTMKGLKPGTAYFLRARPVNGDLVGAWGKPVRFKTTVPAVSFKVASWNVCSEKCSGYSGRARIMADFLNANEVDLFGLQEAGGARVGPTTNAIFSGGKRDFRRATGGGKSRYIFYRPALFTQKAGGLFGVGHGRYTTWAKFVANESGREFFVVDVHLLNGKSHDSQRNSQIRTTVARMQAINAKNDPVIYLGDFNSGRHRAKDSPGVVMRSAGLVDTVDAAHETENAHINSGHSFSTNVLRAGDYVDHIFVSKHFQVPHWKQLVRITGGRYTTPVVSDHNAISAVVSLDSLNTDIGHVTATTTVSGLSGAPLQ